MKTTFKLLTLGLILSLFLCLIITGCGTSAPSTGQTGSKQTGGTLMMPQASDGPALGYPPVLVGAQFNQMTAPAIEMLLHYNAEGKEIPWLATGFTTDTTKKTITLTLRKGVKFHDMTDFNAEAVKWNLEQFIEAKHAAISQVSSVDVVDDYTVRINLKNWDNTFLTNLCGIPGMQISPSAFKKNGKDWAMKNPVGTGPFQFASWDKGINIKYKKFANYWQTGKPYLDGITVTFIQDATTMVLAFENNEIDFLTNQEPMVYLNLQKKGAFVKTVPSGVGGWAMVPNSVDSSSPFSNLKVRQAAQHAVDYAAICKGLFYNEYKPINQWGYPGHWAYNSSVSGYPYDVNKAKQLLAEAGYANGFKTKITYLAGPKFETTYTAMAGYFKTVGIDATLNPVQWPAYQPMAVGPTSNWEGLIWIGNSGDPNWLLAFAQRFGGMGGQFGKLILPDDYKKAIQNAITASDFATEQKYAWEANKLMIDKYCLLLMNFAATDDVVSWKYVHDTGLAETMAVGQWTPQDAWLDKK
jgi:peptide/nickel transport system substrate-binding protein